MMLTCEEVYRNPSCNGFFKEAKIYRTGVKDKTGYLGGLRIFEILQVTGRFGAMAGRRIYSQLFVRYWATVPADE